MKKLILTIGLIVAIVCPGQTQDINWKSLYQNDKNIISLSLGYDYGVTVQAGYYMKVEAFKTLLLGGNFSIPMGENLLDDFKVRYGGQIEVFETNGFSITIKAMANSRRHETELVRMASFGSEFSVTSGYYKPTWHIAAEVGFDQSIITYLRHSDLIKEFGYAEIQNGWYKPSGGYWFYGVQGSKTIGKSIDLIAKLGFTNAQGDDENSILPYSGQLGINYRF